MNSTALFLAGGIAALATAAAAQTPLFTEPGDVAGDRAGNSVAMVGDVDADGAEDFAVGAWGNDVAGNLAGMARVHSGRTRLPIHTWFGSTAGVRFGMTVASVGDLNGDGHAEVAVAAPFGNYVNVYSGMTGATLHQLTGPAGRFGATIVGGGHLDGDGVPDILVGAPNTSPGNALYAFSGASGAPIRTHPSTCFGYLGHSAAFLGDIDGDGIDEYAIGRPLGITGCGNPEVLAYDGLTGTLLWSDFTNTISDQLGWSLSTIGDLTGDGVADLLAGAPQDPGVGCGPCNGKGYVRLLNGATGAQVWQVNGSSFYAGLGYALVSIGDANGDGFEEFAVSQPSTEGCDGNTQAVQIREGLSGALMLALSVPAVGDNFGLSLASGDANDDGLRDLLVGTPCDDLAGADSGATRVYTIVREVRPYCSGKLNSQNCTPSIYTTGVPSFAGGTLTCPPQTGPDLIIGSGPQPKGHQHGQEATPQ